MAEVPVSAFISYSRTDSAFIDRLEADLRAYSFDTWVDRQHLEGGADWARQIEEQIAQREALVVALSPDSITSTWVRREIIFALNAGKHIIPIIVRPVERAPIEIIEKQYINLSVDYTSGLQELRVALLKARTLPPPPRPAQTPLPLLTLPDVSDPLKGLVEIPALPPPLNPDLSAMFMQAQSALARNNLDLAEALLGQIVEQQKDFGYGLADEELQRVRKQLEPARIERLRKMADEAHARGAWGQEIGALHALLESQQKNEPKSAMSAWEVSARRTLQRLLNHTSTQADIIVKLRTRLNRAEECQKWVWLYENACAFAQVGDDAATIVTLMQLWDKVPFYGDPAQIAPTGLKVPQTDRAFVTILSDKEVNRTIDLDKERITIGRHFKECDIFLEDLAVSRLNTTINRTMDGEYVIRDENSANGTYVNDLRVSEQILHEGDKIKVGDTELLFYLWQWCW